MAPGKRPGPSEEEDEVPPVANLTIVAGANAKRLKTQSTPSLLSPTNKVSKNPTPTRRSQRIQNMYKSATNEDIGPVVIVIDDDDDPELVALMDEADSCDNIDKENEPQHSKERELPVSDLDNGSLKEKVESLVQQLQKQEKIIEELKSKVPKRSSKNRTSCEAETTYKSMYIDSQKKVEALTEENVQLRKKLEHALGKLEAVCFAMYSFIVQRILRMIFPLDFAAVRPKW